MSETSATADPPNLLHQLSAASFRIIVHQLHKEALPPGLDDPEEIADRIDAAIAAVAAMLPANADEAEIAARAVSANAQASDCIRRARELVSDSAGAMKCYAQASSMMRTANAARSLLLRVQSVRQKREANQASRDQDAWTEHCAAGLMAAAHNGDPAPEPPPPPAPPEPEPTPPPDDNKFAKCDEAEQYALLYPRRAAEIRAHGGLPPNATYGPPDPGLILALISSASPILKKADEDYPQTVEA